MSLDTGNVLEQYRKQIINEVVQDMLTKINVMLRTSLAVLNGTDPNGHKKSEKVLVKMATRKKRARKACPVKGCKNVFAPRFGGFCNDHRGTSEFKAWAKGKKPVKKAAKKR